MSTPTPVHWRNLVYICLFVGFAGGSLLIVLQLARTFYPRQIDPLQLALGSMAPPTPAEPWWQRMFRFDRKMDSEGQRQGGAGKVGEVRLGTGGVPGIPMAPDQLALREIAEAQVILANQMSVTDEQAMQAIRRAKIQGPFRQFEEERFVSRMLLMKFLDNQEDRQLLIRLHESAVAIAARSEADFEELNYAGIACLLMGDAKAAGDYLQRALDIWPSEGRGYGSVFLFLMVSLAVQGESGPVLQMLAKFQDTYPDWMYIETYMCDLDDLERVYPDAPLLKAIKGYCYTLVLNFGAAEQALLAAQRTGTLDRQASRTIGQWLAEVRQEREP